MKENRKPKAIELLQNGTEPKRVAELTGYSLRRIYDFKKELENQSENAEAKPESRPAATQLQLQSSEQTDSDIQNLIESKLEKAIDTLLEHLEIEPTTDVIDGICKLTELLNSYRNPITNIAELLNHDPNNINKDRTGIHKELDGEQESTGTSEDSQGFVDILTKTAEGTETSD